mgnify:CR=1 FL=1
MVKTKTEQAIIDALEAVAPQHDIDIVDVELVGATKAPCVRVRIEGAEGQSLSLNDVTANTKWVGDVIEELDPISSSYTLEVSSPGMARPLRRPCDFARFVGRHRGPSQVRRQDCRRHRDECDPRARGRRVRYPRFL